MLDNVKNLKIIYLIFLASVASPSFSDDVMTVGWEPYPPFQWQAEDGSLKGLDIDMAKAVLTHAGYKIEFKKMTWNQLLNKGLRNGDIDIALGSTRTTNREKFAHFSTIPYVPWNNVMLIHKLSQKKFSNIKKLSDILDQNITIGVTRSTIYSSDYEQLLNSSEFRKHLVFVAEEQHTLDLLQSLEVDAILTSGMHLDSKSQLSWGIKFHMHLNSNADNVGSHFMLSKYSVTPIEVDRINRSLLELKKNHTLDRIYKQYESLIYKSSGLKNSANKHQDSEP